MANLSWTKNYNTKKSLIVDFNDTFKLKYHKEIFQKEIKVLQLNRVLNTKLKWVIPHVLVLGTSFNSKRTTLKKSPILYLTFLLILKV